MFFSVHLYQYCIFCAETPFGNLEHTFRYFKDLILCHSVNVSLILWNTGVYIYSNIDDSVSKYLDMGWKYQLAEETRVIFFFNEGNANFNTAYYDFNWRKGMMFTLSLRQILWQNHTLNIPGDAAYITCNKCIQLALQSKLVSNCGQFF